MSNQESADAEKVDAAMDKLVDGNLIQAEKLLLEVVANAPETYTVSSENDERIDITFWDQGAFVHYIAWHQDHGRITKSIQWKLCANPGLTIIWAS